MPPENTARAADDESQSGNRPVAKFKHGGIEVTVWPNQGENGTIYNSTISNSYKDDKSGEWKTTTSFSPTDLLVVGELSRQASAKITELKGPIYSGDRHARRPVQRVPVAAIRLLEYFPLMQPTETAAPRGNSGQRQGPALVEVNIGKAI